jgi:single-strand DNA-binding protein
MSNEIGVNLVGNAVSDPELRRTANGTAVASFRIACNSRRKSRETDRWVDGPSSYFQVNCWRDLAVNVAESVVKGQPVVVQGYLTQRVHQRDDGTRRTYTDVEARAVGHDLSRGTARFARTAREPALSASRPSTADAA